MPNVGDHVRVHSRKVGDPPREGVVIEVIGQLLRIKWSTGEETTMVPGPGALAVIDEEEVSSAAKASASLKDTNTKSAQKAKNAAKKSSR